MFLSYLLARLAERSTWLGFTAMATAGGLNLAPEMANAITSTGIAIAGLIGLISQDNK